MQTKMMYLWWKLSFKVANYLVSCILFYCCSLVAPNS